ncbi:MAG TPA: hypothetical protein VFZ53_20530 [Polyangiaceae bacterium]
MTEIRRLFETSPNPATRALLRAGLGERPPTRALERTAAALGVGVTLSAGTAGATALGGTAVAAAAGASAVGAVTIAKWLAIGALSGTVVAGGTTLVRRELESVPPAGARRAPATAIQSAPGVSPLAANERAGDLDPARAASPPFGAESGTARPGTDLDVIQRSPPNQNPHPERATTPPAGDDVSLERRSPLSVEVAAVDRARAFLASGAPERALSELAEYDRIRATGTLDRETWILRIDALVALGKRREAEALARSYLERFPRDAHATRLRELAGMR